MGLKRVRREAGELVGLKRIPGNRESPWYLNASWRTGRASGTKNHPKGTHEPVGLKCSPGDWKSTSDLNVSLVS